MVSEQSHKVSLIRSKKGINAILQMTSVAHLKKKNRHNRCVGLN
jgi:hypothetical protein